VFESGNHQLNLIQSDGVGEVQGFSIDIPASLSGLMREDQKAMSYLLAGSIGQHCKDGHQDQADLQRHINKYSSIVELARDNPDISGSILSSKEGASKTIFELSSDRRHIVVRAMDQANDIKSYRIYFSESSRWSQCYIENVTTYERRDLSAALLLELARKIDQQVDISGVTWDSNGDFTFKSKDSESLRIHNCRAQIESDQSFWNMRREFGI